MARLNSEIGKEIKKNWVNPYFGAIPYLRAMINEDYGVDGEKSIVLRFLCNAGTWRGETARRIKQELKTKYQIK